MQPPESIGLPELTERALVQESVPASRPPAKQRRPFLGFFYVFLTCLFYALASVIVKKLPYISPGELTLVRNFGIFAGALPLAALCAQDDMLGERRWRWLLLTRALLGGFALLFMTTAVAYLPLAEATTIMSSFPVVTAVLARVFLGEECGPSQGALLVLAVCGVLLTVRLPALLGDRGAVTLDSGYALGLAAALGSVFFQSAVFIIVRRVRHLHFSVPMLYFGAVGAVVSACATRATAEFVAPRCGWDRSLVLMVGVLGCLGNLLNTVSVQVEGAGIVAALRTMQIVMAMLFQALFFDRMPDAYNVCGGCLVMFSLSVMGLRRWMLTLPDESGLRKRFKYLLY